MRLFSASACLEFRGRCICFCTIAFLISLWKKRFILRNISSSDCVVNINLISLLSSSSIEAVLAEIEGLKVKGDGEVISLAGSRHRDTRRKTEELERYVVNDVDNAFRHSRRISATTIRRIGNIHTNNKAIKLLENNTTASLENSTKLKERAAMDYQNASRIFEVTLNLSNAFLSHRSKSKILKNSQNSNVKKSLYDFSTVC